MGITLEFELAFSWRYFVIGVYVDRTEPTARLYLPFTRLSITRRLPE